MAEKILIVDDEKNLVEVIEAILTELNDEGENSYEVKKAYNANDAISIAMDFQPDVVLLDLRLPDKPGTEVLSTLKEYDKEVQVIMMTAHASIETAVRSVREEAYDYIQKPLPSRGHLQTLVKNALDRRHLLLEKKKLLMEISDANMALEEANLELQEAKSQVDEKLKGKIKELSLLNQFSQDLLNCNDLATLIEEIPEGVMKLTSSGGVILILKGSSNEEFSVHSKKGDADLSVGDKIEIGKEPFGLVNNKGPWETDEYICSPLTYMEDTLGLLAIKKAENQISPDLIQTITSNLSMRLYNGMLNDTLKASYIEAVLSFVKFEESVDPEIKAHSERVSRLSVEIAGKLDISKAETNNIRFAALLHDLGKVGKGEISSELLSAEIISPLRFLRKSRNILEHLYENYDGSGKPDGQKGDSIPIGSRIVRLSNEFDELISKGDNKKEVLKKIDEKAGSIYDPGVVTTLKEVLKSK
jgi:response regulator RpfG family c-di-GMP phosphodiesterase